MRRAPACVLFLLSLVTCGAPFGTSVNGGAGAPSGITRTRTQLVSWRFTASNDLVGAEAPGFDDSGWEPVTVPHTFDGKKLPFVTYSNAWYRTAFHLDASAAAGRTYVDFGGIDTVADVYLNGQRLGEHRGGYTRFVFDATTAANFGGDNVLAVRVDNTDADTPDCLPSTPVARRYYEPYGGIYRKAWLLTTDSVHVDPTDLASSGVYLTPEIPETGGDGSLAARVILRNTSGSATSVHVVHHVLDAGSAEVATLTDDVELTGEHATSTTSGVVPSPHLWSPADPYLYSVVTEIWTGSKLRDTLSDSIGFRTFRMTPTGFFVNGVSTPLRGVAKHQESEASFTAMSDDELLADWQGMRDIGFNYVRLVHYPHARYEYDLADQMGFVVWAENGYSTPYQWTPTGDTASRELVRQNYNHPSIAFWSAGNESVVRNQPATVDAVTRYAQAIRQEDPSRLVTYANNADFRSDPNFDFIADNIYDGLNGPGPWVFESDAASAHFVSETGGRATVTQHADYARATRVPNVFEPEECIQDIAESCAEVVFRTQATNIPLFTWWAYRDFQLDGRIDGVCNNGIVTYDGAHAKDHYYLFQSFMRPDLTVVHILGALYYVRRGAPDNGIKVYSNAGTLRLGINGVDFGTLANGAYRDPSGREVDDVFDWPVPLFQGSNYVHVDDGAGHSDDAVVVFAGTGGSPPVTLPVTPIVANVTSSNSANPAYYVDRPIAPDVPVYYDFDGTADNSFAAIPPELAGARQIATKRMSVGANLTDLTVVIDAGTAEADVFVITTDDGTSFGEATQAGFADMGVSGAWRDTGMNLVPFRLLSERVAGGSSVTLKGETRDYAVLARVVTGS